MFETAWLFPFLMILSISDALSLLPTFDKPDSKKDFAASPKPKFSRSKKQKAAAPVKFAPVNWQANMETPRSPSPRAVEADGGTGDESADQSPKAAAPSSPPKMRLAPPVTVRYPSGTVALQTYSDTSTFKWPSGSVAVSRLEDRVTASYPNGSMAAIFDSNSNGSVTRPDGTTVLSFSTSSCLLFEKLKGGKMNVKNVSTTSMPVRMELSKEVRFLPCEGVACLNCDV